MKNLALPACLLSLLLGASTACAAPVALRCRGELSPEALDKAGKNPPLGAIQDNTAPADPMLQLQGIAYEALQRSAAVGATRWLAEAATYDVAQADAARFPVVGVSASSSFGEAGVNGVQVSQGRQRSMGINAAASLYDGGRIKGLIQWRKDLERASRYSVQQAREAVVLEAVSTVLERNRYRLQAQVYQQHARKMGCLVEALEAIVAEDKGRGSELVQVRKTQAQAELSRDSALAQSRQIDLKLRKLLGEKFSTGDGISIALAGAPNLGELHRLLERSGEAMQMKAQADAQESYAQALNAGRGPQLSWAVGKSQSYGGIANSAAWQAGISVNVTLFDAGAEKASIKAALARAESSRQQYAEFVATRAERLAEMNETSLTAFEHAKRYVDILRDSDLVRSYTFQQWSQLGRRSLFDVMSAESDHFNLRVAYVNALYDGYAANTQLRSMGGGLVPWLLPDVEH